MGFDPDKYLAKKQSGFDPDAYIKGRGLSSTPKQGTLEKVGNALDYFGRSARTALAAPVSDEFGLGDVGTQIGSFTSPEDKAASGRDLLDLYGQGETFSDKPMSQRFPGLFSETGEGWPLQEGGLFDISPKGVAGFGVEVGTDPLTYVPIVGAGKAIARAIGKGGKAAAKGGADLAVKGVKAVGKGLKDQVGKIDPDTLKMAESTIDSFKQKASTVANKVKPTIAKDFDEMAAIAAKHNIPKEVLHTNDALKYGHDSFIGQSYKRNAQLPVGEQLRVAHNTGVDAIRQATDDLIAKVGGGNVPVDAVEAGTILKQGFSNRIDDIMKSADFTYASAASQMPQGGRLGFSPRAAKELSKELSLLGTSAKRLANNPASDVLRKQGQDTMKLVSKLQQGIDGKSSYSQMIETMQQIGKVSFGGEPMVMGRIPADKRALQDIYFAMSRAANNTVGDFVGKEAAQSLTANNKMLSKMFKDSKGLGKLIQKVDSSPEKVFQELVASGDTQRLNALVEFFGKESDVVRQAKAAYLEGLKRTGRDGKFSIAQLSGKMRNDPKTSRVIKTLFEPSEVQAFEEVMRLSDRFGDYILNPSGTAPFLEGGSILKQLKDTATSDAVTNFLKNIAGGGPGEVPIQSVINSQRAASKAAGGFASPAAASSVPGSGAVGAVRPRPPNMGSALAELPIKGAVRAVGQSGSEDRPARQRRLVEQYDKQKHKFIDKETSKRRWENQP